MMRKLFALVWVTILATVCLAQAPSPTLAFKPDAKTVVSGGKLTGKLTLDFPAGIHAYANPPSKEYMIPLVVSVKGEGYKLTGIKYPKGEMAASGGESEKVSVYQGKLVIPVVVQVPKTVGKGKFVINVAYQTCNEVNCFPPDSKQVEVAVNIVKAVPKRK